MNVTLTSDRSLPAVAGASVIRGIISKVGAPNTIKTHSAGLGQLDQVSIFRQMSRCCLGILIFLLVGCGVFTSLPYQQAKQGTMSVWQGYLDKEIAPGVYIVEVCQIGGYNHDMEVLKNHWVRRAKALCHNGYIGNYEVIQPAEAKLEEFRCDLVFCQRYPMVSGVIHCRKQ